MRIVYDDKNLEQASIALAKSEEAFDRVDNAFRYEVQDRSNYGSETKRDSE